MKILPFHGWRVELDMWSDLAQTLNAAKFDGVINSEPEQWVRENCAGAYWINGQDIIFAEEDDAMMFKLRLNCNRSPNIVKSASRRDQDHGIR